VDKVRRGLIQILSADCMILSVNKA
jgi:hypothetical protein